MDTNVKAMVEAIKAGKTSDANALFETAMKGKLNAALDERKVAVAAQIYGSSDLRQQVMNRRQEFSVVLEHSHGQRTVADGAHIETRTAHYSSNNATHQIGGASAEIIKDRHAIAAKDHSAALKSHLQSRDQTGHDHKLAGYHNLMIQHHTAMVAFHKEHSK